MVRNLYDNRLMTNPMSGVGADWVQGLNSVMQQPNLQQAAGQATNKTPVYDAAAASQQANANPLTGASGARAAQAQGQSGTGISPNDYNTPFISGSNEWYGGLSNYGAQLAASDPNAFWGFYGPKQQGWVPGGNNMAFMAGTFDPRALGAAMFGKEGYSSTEGYLAGQSAIADKLTAGNRAAFIDPASVVGNVIDALSTNNFEKLAELNPALASVVNRNIGNPAGQVSSIVEFLGSALAGSMPGDVLDAFLQTITSLGQQWSYQLGQPGSNLDHASFARFLSQTLGPTLGL